MNESDVRRYYAAPAVRERMWDFLGGKGSSATSVFITPCEDPYGDGPPISSPSSLNFFLGNGLEVGRSLWDMRNLIVHLDIEYVNFDFPAEPYLDPLRTFRLQRPVFEATRTLLSSFGIQPLFLLSGRGFHAVWRVDMEHHGVARAVSLGHVDDEVLAYYAQQRGPGGQRVGRKLALAHSALGLVMEYLAHRLIETAAENTAVPLEITALEVPPGERGRELISLDISEYGDPLNMRMIRVPFSVYLKPWRKPGVLPNGKVTKIPTMVLAPIEGGDLADAVPAMRNTVIGRKLADRVSTTIPECGDGTTMLIETYDQSPLALFHKRYYHERHHPPAQWPASYDRIDLRTLPAAVAESLRTPNDHLLKPAGIRRLVRCLLSRGWHPRHVAGLLRSKYERDYGWGNLWYAYNAATRADFYVRLFAGLIDAGLDEDDEKNEDKSFRQLEHAAPFGRIP
ncbi:MAG: hypothetical protein GF363_13735 [Chitinivibrionales bacterium]|nr:hypothetical protein [Chitinivibrionales bacterium]